MKTYPSISPPESSLITESQFRSAESKSSLVLLLSASALTVALWFVPYAEIAVYPFRLFVTFVHEAGHALAAVLTFGSVKGISLSWDGSGLTYTAGGVGFVISSAGYLSSTIYGASLLMFSKNSKLAKPILIVTALVVLTLTLFRGANLTIWIVGPLMGAALLLIAGFASRKAAQFFIKFLAIQSMLNAVFDLRTLFRLSVYSNVQTDAVNLQQATGGLIPAVVWAVLWSVISVAILSGALWSYYRSLSPRSY